MLPDLLLIILLGGAYGALFHLWRGKNFRELIIYFLTGIIGFGIGQAVGNVLGLNVFLIGALHIIEASVMSWVCLFVMQWLKV